MALTGIHVVGSAKILDATAVDIPQVEGQAMNAGSNVIVESTAGQVYPTYSAIMNQAPRMNLTTGGLKALLDKVGLKGMVLATGFEMYNQLVAAATGLRGTGSVQQKMAIATGIIIPRSINVSQNQVARLTFDVIGINAAGTTCPVVVSETVTLPVNTGVAALWTMGPVKINGTALAGVQSVNIDFGTKEFIIEGDGFVYPIYAGIEMVSPSITIKVKDSAAFAVCGMAGLAQTATDSVVFLRKLSNDGTRVADVTAEHISFSIDQGLWIAPDKGGQHPSTLDTTIKIQPTHDGTNDPLVLSTATAIS